ncbi:hypothetical protein E4100_08660 [Soehngenia longivitae]|uniref:Uncharacterized protein n=1 Tax=Soehngenia longivitae TaxID=2562294 RepID=A0A4Z0D0P5_9FIRM|nr:hypothetical protein [Soehngenia longivitae]TFZ39290.1 hypothetical protein E4100_08660 [Soehngenia longivitae]
MKPNIKYIVLILSLMLSIFLAGCMNENTENENNQIVDENKKEVISSSPVEDFSQLTLLESFNYDYDLDGTEEAINLYTSAQKNSDGEMMWDDGQIFKLIIHDDDKIFILFDEYVQLGKINYYVYLENDIFTITVISPRTASFTVTDYVFDKDTNSFLVNRLIEKITDINMLKI